ncbi:MAG: hypothetical protein R2809_07575 [Flavobacteriales bacterium]
MKYYKIDFSSEVKVIGRKYPQLTPVSGTHLEDPMSILQLSDNYPMQSTHSVFTLNKSAKLTDVLSGVSPYFVVNERVKEAILKFTPKYVFFIPIKIIEPTNNKWYVLYDPYSDELTEMINFDETIFCIVSKKLEIIEEFKLNSSSKDKRQLLRDKFAEYETPPIIRVKKLVIKNKYATLDFFSISPFIMDPIISENIKSELDDKKITGFEYMEMSISFT